MLTTVSSIEKLMIIVSTLMLAQYQYLFLFYCILVALLLQVSQLFYVVSLYIEVARPLFYLDFNFFISVLINEKHLSVTLAMTIKGKRSQLTKQLPREPNRIFLLILF